MTEWREIQPKTIYKGGQFPPSDAGSGRNGQKVEGQMVRLLKVLGFLLVVAAIGIVGYAYLGDLSPDQEDRATPVELDAG